MSRLDLQGAIKLQYFLVQRLLKVFTRGKAGNVEISSCKSRHLKPVLIIMEFSQIVDLLFYRAESGVLQHCMAFLLQRVSSKSKVTKKNYGAIC